MLHTHKWVMSHMKMNHVTHIKRSHVSRAGEFCSVTHMWMSHATYLNESRHTHKKQSCLSRRRVLLCHTHMKESCHIYEWIMSRTSKGVMSLAQASFAALPGEEERRLRRIKHNLRLIRALITQPLEYGVIAAETLLSWQSPGLTGGTFALLQALVLFECLRFIPALLLMCCAAQVILVMQWHIHMCDMTHSCVWLDSFIYVTRLIHMCVIWLIHMCVIWLIHMCVIWLIHVMQWRIHMCDMTHSCVMCDMTNSYMWHDWSICLWHDWFICGTRLIHMCVIWLIHVCVTWLIHMCDMTHSYVWHDSFIYVRRQWVIQRSLIWMSHVTYMGVAS